MILMSYNLELRHPRCVYNKMLRVRSVKHNYLLVTYNDMFRPTRRPSSGYRSEIVVSVRRMKSVHF